MDRNVNGLSGTAARLFEDHDYSGINAATGMAGLALSSTADIERQIGLTGHREAQRQIDEIVNGSNLIGDHGRWGVEFDRLGREAAALTEARTSVLEKIRQAEFRPEFDAPKLSPPLAAEPFKPLPNPDRVEEMDLKRRQAEWQEAFLKTFVESQEEARRQYEKNEQRWKDQDAKEAEAARLWAAGAPARARQERVRQRKETATLVGTWAAVFVGIAGLILAVVIASRDGKSSEAPDIMMPVEVQVPSETAVPSSSTSNLPPSLDRSSDTICTVPYPCWTPPEIRLDKTG